MWWRVKQPQQEMDSGKNKPNEEIELLGPVHPCSRRASHSCCLREARVF